MAPDPSDFAGLVRARRTSMLVDGQRPVPRDLVEQLCELAQWAPNHKRTWPWRFALFAGQGRARLGEVISAAMAAREDPADKVEKALTKYMRTPATLVVGAAPGGTPQTSAENRDATAAGVQNILLAATTHGLATYWSSCPKGANDPVAALCGFEPGTHVTAVIYLGWATESVTAPDRPPVRISIIE